MKSLAPLLALTFGSISPLASANVWNWFFSTPQSPADPTQWENQPIVTKRKKLGKNIKEFQVFGTVSLSLEIDDSLEEPYAEVRGPAAQLETCWWHAGFQSIGLEGIKDTNAQPLEARVVLSRVEKLALQGAVTATVLIKLQGGKPLALDLKDGAQAQTKGALVNATLDVTLRGTSTLTTGYLWAKKLLIHLNDQSRWESQGPLVAQENRLALGQESSATLAPPLFIQEWDVVVADGAQLTAGSPLEVEDALERKSTTPAISHLTLNSTSTQTVDILYPVDEAKLRVAGTEKMPVRVMVWGISESTVIYPAELELVGPRHNTLTTYGHSGRFQEKTTPKP